MDAVDAQGGDGPSEAEATRGLEGDQRIRGASVPSEGGTDKGKKFLLKRIGQLHRAHAELQQFTAQRELDENKSTAELRAATEVAAGHDSPARKHEKGKGQELKVRINSSLQGILSAPAIKIPYKERVPTYKSWSYLMSNELATEVGSRIFYTDATGETIPASDSEDEDRRGEGSLEGAHRESEEWVMRQLAQEMGVTPEVVEILAKRLDAGTAVVEARLHALLAERNGEQKDTQKEAASSVETGVDKCASPHHRLPASQPTTETPCGPDCWHLVPCTHQPTAGGPPLLQNADAQQQQQPGVQLAQGGNAQGSSSVASAGQGSGMALGPCNAECSCAKSKNFCEKFCACGPSCSIRFVGCDCKSGCRTKACPCFASGHECDPDACTACTTGCACNNMRLRFRQHKRVSMGKSAIAGWGSFLMDGAKRGELVGEYTGELVTQAEADRRGKAYDRDDNSYLFNLNEEWVIDARRRGNKLRFANHSTDPNCAAKILMVDGDHRVGIFASKDIVPGTELFYDYCYTKDQAPIWAQTNK
ncbi:hypothetical protein WJX75_009030 [Coccomyxa subellipsoidea]|uniref:SET domain-containing protein n=1 Tax=Coccomyxa subellipsoidea TaxID=248742 RepID=A0ABR2Z1S7_9CHLO